MTTGTLRDSFQKYVLPDLNNRKTIERYNDSLRNWERFSSNPPADKITNQTLAEWRNACITHGFAAATINNRWGSLRVILRRLGPQQYRNPLGEGIIDHIPHMRRLPQEQHLPRIWTMDELSAMYDSAETIQQPRGRIPAEWWWRCLIVVGYNACPRIEDLMALETAAVDWNRSPPLLKWRASKTRKIQIVPLNEVTAAHLRTIWSNRKYVFPRPDGERYRAPQRLYRWFHEIQAKAGLPDTCGFHTLRKSGASWYWTVNPGAAQTILGHSIRGVTSAYINPEATGQLTEAVNALPQPAAFQRILQQPVDNVVCRENGVRATEWDFGATWACYRGRRIDFVNKGGRYLRALQLLVTATRPLTFDDFRALLFWDKQVTRTTVKTTLCTLRDRLQSELDLPPYFDPIPQTGERDGYYLRLP